MGSVYSAVRTDSLYKADYVSSLKVRSYSICLQRTIHCRYAQKHNPAFSNIQIHKNVTYLYPPWRCTGGVEVQLHSLLTSAPMSMSDQPHGLSGLPSGKKPQELTEERGGWAPESVPPVRKRDISLGSVIIRTPDRPARGLATYTDVIQVPIHKSTHAMTKETGWTRGTEIHFARTLQTSSYLFKFV